MADNPNQFKKAPPRKRQPVKRVAVSEETKRAYEELMHKRDVEDRDYRANLDPANKGR